VPACGLIDDDLRPEQYLLQDHLRSQHPWLQEYGGGMGELPPI
jgi:hypothetical protein